MRKDRLAALSDGLIGMLARSFREEQTPRVDDRLVRVVRIIVEQYNGDVRAFVESGRCRVEVIQKAEAMPGNTLIKNSQCQE